MLRHMIEALLIAFGLVSFELPIAEVTSDEIEWAEFWLDSYEEHADAFTRHFESLTYKRSANGRSMVNGKFVKMGA